VIERMVLLAEAPVVTADAIGRLLQDAGAAARAPLPAPTSPLAGVRPFVRGDSHTPEMLRDALARHGGNRSRAAQALGLTLRQFSYRCLKLGV
jgi:Nif-specific regulatory protein